MDRSRQQTIPTTKPLRTNIVERYISWDIQLSIDSAAKICISKATSLSHMRSTAYFSTRALTVPGSLAVGAAAAAAVAAAGGGGFCAARGGDCWGCTFLRGVRRGLPALANLPANRSSYSSSLLWTSEEVLALAVDFADLARAALEIWTHA
jgi:hypothetical protein